MCYCNRRGALAQGTVARLHVARGSDTIAADEQEGSRLVREPIETALFAIPLKPTPLEAGEGQPPGAPGGEDAARMAGQIVWHSPGLTEADTIALQRACPLQPQPAPSPESSATLAIMAGPAGGICLSRAWRDGQTAYQRLLLLSAEDWATYAPDPGPLFALAADDAVPAPDGALAALPAPEPQEWTPEERAALLEKVFANTENGSIDAVLHLLERVLVSEQAVVAGFPDSLRLRLALVRVLASFMPAHSARELMFTSFAGTPPGPALRLVFTDEDAPPTDALPWGEGGPLTESTHPYIARLATLWAENRLAFHATIARIRQLAAAYPPGMTGAAILDEAVTRDHQDQAVAAGEPVPTADLIATLGGIHPPSGDLAGAYIAMLTHAALTSREVDATLAVVRFAAQDEDRQAALMGLLTDALADQPDDVYAFARICVAEDPESGMRDVLRQSAREAMSLALENGEPETIENWLNLLAREPANWGLQPVLHDGLLAAAALAYEDSTLAQNLLLIAIKRDADLVSGLLADEAFVAALDEPLRTALLDPPAGDREGFYANGELELFLLAMRRAITDGCGCISVTEVRTLWSLLTDHPAMRVAERYRPQPMVEALAASAASMTEAAIEAFVTLMLSDGEKALFLENAAGINAASPVRGWLANAFLRSGSTIGAVREISANLQAHDIITYEDGIQIYIDLLAGWDWHEGTLPLVEVVTRALARPDSSLRVPSIALWKILQLAAHTHNEAISRVALRRLLEDIGQTPNSGTLLADLARVRALINWDDGLEGDLGAWWRAFTARQPVAALTRWSAGLADQKAMDAYRDVVHTAIAMRKAFKQANLATFAEDVRVTHRVLLALSDAFDPTGKGSPAAFDILTLSDEFAARAVELDEEERRVLAADLKELARLITSLAANRTKSSLIRSDEALERQLQSGEQAPQSGLDVIKWLSSFLDHLPENEPDRTS
jgi:hypothetical protein